MSATALSLIICLSAGITQHTPPPHGSVESGWAVYYSPGILERVAAKRGLHLCATCDGYAARPLCSGIGSTFMAKIGTRTFKLVQADCAQPKDYQWQLEQNRVVELAYPLAVKVGMVRRGKVRAQVWGTK